MMSDEDEDGDGDGGRQDLFRVERGQNKKTEQDISNPTYTQDRKYKGLTGQNQSKV